MGLPDTLVDRLGPDIYTRHQDLRHLDAHALIELVQSSTAPTDQRFAAGSYLAMIGDPRIQHHQPQMVQLTGGTIRIGLPYSAVAPIVQRWQHVGVQTDWISKECPEHSVRIAPFAIARYPVTNHEFHIFLQHTQQPWLPSSWPLGIYPAHLANHPVYTIPPEAADAYATWLAALTQRPFRLPTEAEWEYAASNGDDREYPWGNTFEPDRANTAEYGPLCTTPIGMYPRGQTAHGIHDMAGNVEEYTADPYRPYAGSTAIADDLLLKFGHYRVARGGSFTRFGDLARCRRRHGWYHSPIYAMGFRLAESLPTSAQ